MHIDEKASAVASLGMTEVLNSLPDGAYITDRNRTILFWNRAAERITGWPASEVVGRTCFDNVLCHVDQDGEKLCGHERCPLHRSIVTGEASEQSLLVFARSRHGEQIAVEVSVSPLRNETGGVVGGVAVCRAVSAAVVGVVRGRGIVWGVGGRLPSGDRRVTFALHSEASQLVGGDFARVDRIDADRYAVLLLDVRGHGLAAALYTMYLRAQWDDRRPVWADPAGVLAAINRHVNELSPDAGYLATAVALAYDAEHGEVRLVRAGHPAPVVLGIDGGGREVGAQQAALGLLGDTVYAEDRVTLQPGESLLLYSDGAVEMLDQAGGELGLSGLLDSIQCGGRRVPDLAGVPERLLRRSNCIRQPDDLTLLSLTRH